MSAVAFVLVFSVSPTHASQPIAKLHGLNFGPFSDGADPSDSSVSISEFKLRSRMAAVAPYTQWVRTFSTLGGHEKAGRIAHELGLEIAVGVWID